MKQTRCPYCLFRVEDDGQHVMVKCFTCDAIFPTSDIEWEECCESCGELADWDGDSEPILCPSCRYESAEHFCEGDR